MTDDAARCLRAAAEADAYRGPDGMGAMMGWADNVLEAAMASGLPLGHVIRLSLEMSATIAGTPQGRMPDFPPVRTCERCAGSGSVVGQSDALDLCIFCDGLGVLMVAPEGGK